MAKQSTPRKLPVAKAPAKKPLSKKLPHDMGGEPAGPLDTHEHTPTLTERRIDAMMQLLRNKPRGYWTTDENRRTIESLAPKTYRDSSYYERWTYAMRSLLVEKGVLTEAEVSQRLAEVRSRLASPAKSVSSNPGPVRKPKPQAAGKTPRTNATTKRSAHR